MVLEIQEIHGDFAILKQISFKRIKTAGAKGRKRMIGMDAVKALTEFND